MRVLLTLCLLLPIVAVPAQVRPSAPPPVTGVTTHAPPADANPEASRPWKSDTRATDAPEAPRDKGAAARVLDTVLNLALVLVLAYVAMLGVKRYLAGTLRLPGLPAKAQPRLLQVVETLPLAQGRSLYLVRAGARTYLIGAAGQQFILLGEVTGDGAIEAALPPATPATFDAALARVLPAAGLPDREQTGPPAPADRRDAR